MLRNFRHLRSTEFIVLWVFLGASLAGLFGVTYLVLDAAKQPPVVVAPTSAEYQAEASAIMEPFLTQAFLMSSADFEGAGKEAVRVLVVTTQERMLRVRVPSDLRDAHLAFVLMLERWHRALDGDDTMRDVAIHQLQEAVDANPWVRIEHDEADDL